MKKTIISVLALICTGIFGGAFAKNVPVTAITPFSSSNPPAEIAVKINSNIQVTDDIVLFEGYIAKGKLVLQNGALAFVPYTFVNVHNETGNFEPQTYGILTGLVNQNGQMVNLGQGTPVNISQGQMFILNFRDIVAKQVEMPQNVTETPSELVINTMEPATIESQRPFAKRLPGLPVTDLSTMDATNKYNPAMPLQNILKNRNGEFLR